MSGGVCPTECGGTRDAGHLTCRRCWGQVPRHLRDLVKSSWERFPIRELDREARQEAAIAWRLAATEAIDAVKAKRAELAR